MHILALAALLSAMNLPDALVKSIAAGNQEWIEGLKRHDAARIAATYDENAMNCHAGGECVHGRAAFEKQTLERLAKIGDVEDAWVKSAQTVLDGDFAYEWGRAGFRTAAGKESAGRYLTVWRKQADGTWKIFHNLVLP